MSEIYYLNQKQLPTIPTPHDCVVKAIKIEDKNLVFVFENDISYHDSIKSINPKAKSLVISYHLLDDASDILLYRKQRLSKLFNKALIYKQIDLEKSLKELTNLTKNNLEYLYHNVGYCSIIIKLWATSSIVLDLSVDYIEFNWIE